MDFYTRRGHRWSHKFPGLCESARHLPGDGFWLDGELVVMTGEGRSCYGSLQEAVAHLDQSCLAYYVFDLLWLGGENLCLEPIEVRKRKLEELVGGGAWNLQYVDHIVGSGPEFFAAACDQKVEGIVSKRLGSIYTPGRRSLDWVKVKCAGWQEHRFVRWEWWKEI